MTDEREINRHMESCERLSRENMKLKSDIDVLLKAGDIARNRERLEKALDAERRASMRFIQDCAKLLGLPKLDANQEYGGGAVRKGILMIRQQLTDWESQWGVSQHHLSRLEVEIAHLRKRDGVIVIKSDDTPQLQDIRVDSDAARADRLAEVLVEERHSQRAFVKDCAKLLGLPDRGESRQCISRDVANAIKILQQELADHDKAWEEDRQNLERLEKERVANDEENAKLIGALGFYADHKNWRTSAPDRADSECDVDRGSTARGVLEQDRTQTKPHTVGDDPVEKAKANLQTILDVADRMDDGSSPAEDTRLADVLRAARNAAMAYTEGSDPDISEARLFAVCARDLKTLAEAVERMDSSGD